MSIVMSMKRVRRSTGQWRELLSRFPSSGLGVTEFCRRESVSTASFSEWRCRLGAADRVVARKAEAPAAFVDLGAVSCGVFTPAAAMELHLDLGGGLSLHLVRPLMFFPEGQVRVHLCGRPVDMRRSFDGLYALTRQELGQDPMSGRLFVFINRRGTQMKVLYWDRSGFCIWAKRLEQGRFVGDWSKVTTREMDWTSLKLLLEGMEARVVRRRYRAATTETRGASL